MSVTMTIVGVGRNPRYQPQPQPQRPLQANAVVAVAAEENNQIHHAQRLFEILVTHEHLRDPLSYELFNEGKDLMEYVCNQGQQPTPEGLTERFNQLKNLLVNPFSPHTLEDPVCVNDIVQERYFAEFRNRCLAAKGLPQNRIEEHEFTAQVIPWINCVESSFFPPQDRVQAQAHRVGQVAPMVIKRDPLKEYFERVNLSNKRDLESCLNFFEASEAKFLTNRMKNIETRSQLRESRKIVAVQQHQIVLANAKRDGEVQAFREDCQRHKEEVVGHLNNIGNDYKKSVDEYQRSLNKVEKEVVELKEDLNATNSKLAQAEAGNASRDSTIASLYYQLQSAHQRIGQAQQGKKKGCVIC